MSIHKGPKKKYRPHEWRSPKRQPKPRSSPVSAHQRDRVTGDRVLVRVIAEYTTYMESKMGSPEGHLLRSASEAMRGVLAPLKIHLHTSPTSTSETSQMTT